VGIGTAPVGTAPAGTARVGIAPAEQRWRERRRSARLGSYPARHWARRPGPRRPFTGRTRSPHPDVAGHARAAPAGHHAGGPARTAERRRSRPAAAPHQRCAHRQRWPHRPGRRVRPARPGLPSDPPRAPTTAGHHHPAWYAAHQPAGHTPSLVARHPGQRATPPAGTPPTQAAGHTPRSVRRPRGRRATPGGWSGQRTRAGRAAPAPAPRAAAGGRQGMPNRSGRAVTRVCRTGRHRTPPAVRADRPRPTARRGQPAGGRAPSGRPTGPSNGSNTRPTGPPNGSNTRPTGPPERIERPSSRPGQCSPKAEPGLPGQRHGRPADRRGPRPDGLR